jgi:hypothetical protein
MSLESHALAEFRAAGWMDENGKYSDDIQESICKDMLELLSVFSSQGHSGFSASYLLNCFEKLARFEPIVPLTGEDSEWNDTGDYGYGDRLYQNKRCSRVFKQEDRFDGQAYDVGGKVFIEHSYDDNGEETTYSYTNGDSAVPITFPYTPKTEYVDVGFREE